jgi:hypothetical protein
MSQQKVTVTRVKKGRRVNGALYTLPDGRAAFLERRKLADIIRDRKRTISDAVRDGTAGWAFDYEHLLNLRANKVPFVGVQCVDSGDLWLTLVDRLLGENGRGMTLYGRLVRVLPLSGFKRRLGNVKLR